MEPTAELLDVASLRADDAGTQSLVFDPQSGTHTWRRVPYQAPDANRDHTTLELTLDDQGGAQGTLTLESVGRGGSGLRRTARNAEVFKQATQRLASIFLPNATATNARPLEVESLRVPASIRVDVATGTFARVEGDSLRVKLPYRGRLDDMVRLLDDELVLGVKGGKAPRPAPETAKSR